MRFVRYTVVWIAENLSIPFWVAGHVHLSTNIYDDMHEVIASLGMNAIVFIGFLIGYHERNNR